jgi:glycosyltransferase involved in cell wall biosynthesis
MPAQPAKTISVIIPARNEETLIGHTLDALLAAAWHPAPPQHLSATDSELIVVDDRSTDRTASIVAGYAQRWGVRLAASNTPRAPGARNSGASLATGRILIFVDADTIVPAHALGRVRQLCDQHAYQAGICGLASLEGGFRSWCWWTFWSHVRRLPLARAKAMPAFMFCTREAFAAFGPFDERVAIGEEWPILAGLYRARPDRLAYDRRLVARTSSRRMDLQLFGYTRTLLHYIWAVLHESGRNGYSDAWRATQAPPALHDKRLQ